MDNSNEGLIYDGLLPVVMTCIEQFPEDSEIAVYNEANESLLKANLVLHEPPDVDEHDEISLELKRQDLKISLLLDLVGELLRQNNLIPDKQKIKLTSNSIECESPETIKQTLIKGNKIEIDLYISPSTPKPLKLFGEIVEIVETSNEIDIRFTSLNQNVKDWLEKTIFKHHRRTIAQGLSKNP